MAEPVSDAASPAPFRRPQKVNPAPTAAPGDAALDTGAVSPAAMNDARQAAALAARQSYGRLLSVLAYRWRDIAAAEDALAQAFAAALDHWPADGVPRNPDAWLMTAARRNLLQAARHLRVELDPTVTILFEQAEAEAPAFAVADERLRLMFVCAHPSIDRDIHTALMLQTVLGLEAKQIAAAFLVRPTTLAQRLVRAKTRIRASGVRFEFPNADELPERCHAVLEAVYAAYGVGWQHQQSTLPTATQAGAELAGEARFLAELCVDQLPDEAEAWGLLALILYCEARRPASLDADGEFVPLPRQDTQLWDGALIGRAEQALQRAAALRAPGVFQIEAAIQSAHCQRAFGGPTPWHGIVALYETLLRLAPSVGAAVGQAVAIAEAGDPAAARERLRAIETAQVVSYQPYWVAQAFVESRLGVLDRAKHAYQMAIGLTEQPPIRDYLHRCLRALDQ